MDWTQLEDLAQEVRRVARLGDEDLVLAGTIAERFIGRRDAVVLAPKLRGPAYFRDTDNGFQILVRPDAEDINFHVAHEIGHIAIRTFLGTPFSLDEEERAANFVGAAVLAPKATVARAYSYFGERLGPLARFFGLSQTSIVLRLGDVRGDARAVVTRTGNVLVPTQCTFPWASLPAVQVAKGHRLFKGIAKAKLGGGIDEGRVALRVK